MAAWRADPDHYFTCVDLALNVSATATHRSFTEDSAIESSVPALSWRAILAGAVAAAATTTVLILLGTGLGLSTISPWPNSGASAATFTIMAGIWLIVVQWLSSGIGGYLTGRLRTKWVRVHTHEVFFRDTAHGFLTWAVAMLFGALIVSSTIHSAASTATQAASTLASGVAGSASNGAQTYAVDTLLRGEKADLASSGQQSRREITGILANGIRNGDVPAADKTYLAQEIATRTGISQEDAQKRVDDVIAQEKASAAKARETADAARKSAAAVSIFLALSMLIGAFIASAAAAYGGNLRDEHA